MGLSKMSSRDRTIVAVLGVIILVALVGIGVLAAKLISDREPAAVTEVVVLPQPTITAVAPPEPQVAADTPVVNVNKPVQIARMEGVGPGSPVIIAAQALHPGRRYRIDITAADGAKVKINGSWSQGAVAMEGPATAPQIEFFEGVTPYQIAVESPAPNPKMWSVSVSVGPANILDKQSLLVITIWDVTEGE